MIGRVQRGDDTLYRTMPRLSAEQGNKRTMVGTFTLHTAVARDSASSSRSSLLLPHGNVRISFCRGWYKYGRDRLLPPRLKLLQQF